jgi:hypothetical protein
VEVVGVWAKTGTACNRADRGGDTGKLGAAYCT